MMQNGIMSTYLPLRVSPQGNSLLQSTYVCNSIHYNHRKLIVHILIENNTSDEAEVEHSTVCCATAIDQTVLVATDLGKCKSY